MSKKGQDANGNFRAYHLANHIHAVSLRAMGIQFCCQLQMNPICFLMKTSRDDFIDPFTIGRNGKRCESKKNVTANDVRSFTAAA